MRRLEYLLLCLEEELLETAHRVSKAIRFGLDEVQPSQDKTNGERIAEELEEVLEVLQMINEKNVGLPCPRNVLFVQGGHYSPRNIQSKRIRVEEYMRLSQKLGILEEDEK